MGSPPAPVFHHHHMAGMGQGEAQGDGGRVNQNTRPVITIMNTELKYYESQSFRNEPDCYDGENCDQLRPRWMTSFPKEGDVEDEDSDVLKLKLDARRLPPGTRITIEIPCCPQCGEPADSVDPKKRVRRWPDCRCGFSWSNWAEEEYA